MVLGMSLARHTRVNLGVRQHMHPLVAEYRSLPPSSDHLPDTGPNDRKCRILFELDDEANDADVSQLLLDVLRDPHEFDLARVEAIKVIGLYISKDNPLAGKLWDEVYRIAESDDDQMLQGWAEQSVDFRREPDVANPRAAADTSDLGP